MGVEKSTDSGLHRIVVYARKPGGISDLNSQIQRQQAEIKRLAEELAEKDRVHREETTVLKKKIEDLEEGNVNTRQT